MTVDEASEWLIEIGQALFPQKGEYDSTMSRLKGVLERMLEQKGLPIDIRLDDQHLRKTHCKVYVRHLSNKFLAQDDYLVYF